MKKIQIRKAEKINENDNEIIHDGKVIGRYSTQELLINEELLALYYDELRYQIHLTEEDMNIKDFIESNIIEKDSFLFNKKIVLLNYLKINENYRSQQIGSSLLAIIESDLRKEKIDMICLKPYPIDVKENEEFENVYSKVKRFYQKNNYKFTNDLFPFPYMYKKIFN